MFDMRVRVYSLVTFPKLANLRTFQTSSRRLTIQNNMVGLLQKEKDVNFIATVFTLARYDEIIRGGGKYCEKWTDLDLRHGQDKSITPHNF